MLEVARLWQEQSLDPRRPVLFAAWGGGTLDNSGADSFLGAERSFLHLPTTTRLQTTAVFQIDNVGAGGDELFIHPNSSDRLTELLQETAGEINLVAASEFAQVPTYADMLQMRVPWVYLSWTDAEVSPEQDTLDANRPRETDGRLASFYPCPWQKLSGKVDIRGMKAMQPSNKIVSILWRLTGLIALDFVVVTIILAVQAGNQTIIGVAGQIGGPNPIVYVRDEPHGGGQILTALRRGTDVVIINSTERGHTTWYEIAVNDYRVGRHPMSLF